MEKFKKQIKKQIKNNIILAVLFFVLFVVLVIMDATNAWSTFLPAELTGGNESLDFMAGFRTGFCSSIIGFAIFRAIFYSRVLKDEKKLKALYINKTDERNLLIAQKASSTSFAVTIIGLAFACVVVSFFSKLVLMVLVLVIVFVSAVQIGSYIYYSKKY